MLFAAVKGRREGVNLSHPDRLPTPDSDARRPLVEWSMGELAVPDGRWTVAGRDTNTTSLDDIQLGHDVGRQRHCAHQGDLSGRGPAQHPAEAAHEATYRRQDITVDNIS
jgi:hypothetical protein